MDEDEKKKEIHFRRRRLLRRRRRRLRRLWRVSGRTAAQSPVRQGDTGGNNYAYTCSSRVHSFDYCSWFTLSGGDL